jgi:catechol 2,3-dioxygenase-like lactoylglutathione lyase family enzyme
MGMPALFMVELAVSDFAAAVAWYRDVLRLRLIGTDPANGFALLQGDAGGRVALKAGVPSTAGVVLHFEVADLAAELARLAAAGVTPGEPVTTSPEGYREAFVRDPDGYRVGLFEWVRPGGPRRGRPGRLHAVRALRGAAAARGSPGPPHPGFPRNCAAGAGFNLVPCTSLVS